MAQRPVARAAYSGVLNLPMPSIAVVEGYALGGGLEIALSCDMVIAGSAAVVGLPEVSVGVIPGGGGTQLLTRRIGWSRAAGMIFTARRMPASEAAARARVLSLCSGVASGVGGVPPSMRLQLLTDAHAAHLLEVMTRPDP